MAELKIKFYEPTLPQIKALDILYMKRPFITLMNYGRQTGKSYMALMEAMNMCITKYGWNGSPQYRVMFVTPSYNLAAKHIQTIEAMFENQKEAAALLFKDKGIKVKQQEIHFMNGAVLLFRSAEMGDNLRGDTVNFMFIDEAAFIPKKTIMEILLPMLTRTKGRILIFSTPNGRNWFYDMFVDGQKEENHKNIISIRSDYRELNDEDVNMVINSLRQNMTSNQFAREVLGEFVTDGSLFSNVEGRLFPEGHEIDYKCDRFIGIDVGVVNDFTVLTCINKHGEVIDIDRFNTKEDNLSYEQYKQRIKDFVTKHDQYLVAAYFEINNKDLLYEDIMTDETMYKIEAFNTNISTKPKIINNLIKMFEDGDILIPDYDVLIAELYAYASKTNPITGKVQFQNQGEAHDDTVSSLALAAWARREWCDGGYTQFE